MGQDGGALSPSLDLLSEVTVKCPSFLATGMRMPRNCSCKLRTPQSPTNTQMLTKSSTEYSISCYWLILLNFNNNNNNNLFFAFCYNLLCSLPHVSYGTIIYVLMKARITVGLKLVHLGGQFPVSIHCQINSIYQVCSLLLMYQEIAFTANNELQGKKKNIELVEQYYAYFH